MLLSPTFYDGDLLTTLRRLYQIIQISIANDSSDCILKLTVLSFIISVLCTVKVYERKPRDLYIVCQKSAFNLKVASSLRDKIGDYEPPWWYNRHFGTMIPFGYNPNITYEREIFTVDDACFAVDWFPRKPNQQLMAGKTIKICVFYPGLGLGSQNVKNQHWISWISIVNYVFTMTLFIYILFDLQCLSTEF